MLQYNQDLSNIAPAINGRNPFYRVHAIESMFDQSKLPPEHRTLPLRRFQKSVIALASQYRFANVYAPSQSGKSTGGTALAAELMYEYPGINILILSTTEDQAARLLIAIRNNYIKCHREPLARELDPKGGDSSTLLRLKHTGSSILALPHSMKALIGNPARFILFDELAAWDKEDPAEMYAQGVARTGDKGGSILSISTFKGEGLPDPTVPRGYRGNYFHHKWAQTYAQRRDPNKTSVSLLYNLNVSPNLARDQKIIKAEMDKEQPGLFEEHYMGVPMKRSGRAIFGTDFERKTHVTPDAQMPISPDYPLFLCFDPGYNMAAAVLGQLNEDVPSLMYLRSWTGKKQTVSEFIDSVLIKVKRQFPNFEILYFMDVAGRGHNDQTGTTNISVLASKIGYNPITQKQNIEPGVEIMRSFMRRRNGFYISDHKDCEILVEALESGLVCEERGGVLQSRYRKDGYYEHPGDAARYPAHYLCSGLTADVFQGTGSGFLIARSPYS